MSYYVLLTIPQQPQKKLSRDSYLTMRVKTKNLLHFQITLYNYLKYNSTLFKYVW